ncbi:MAG TPA: hypothetical protein VGN64_01195 [Dyadobacter sp.]|jgi:hypothetical protein|nr:hypothetical protein [Dyadobacter sp.]
MIHFDNTPTVYWLLGYLLAGLVILSSIGKKIPAYFYILGCLALLVFMRLPGIVFNRELNPDESQMLSHALTLWQDPVYWRAADGTTIGPLDIYLLVIPKFFGLTLDYTVARAMGLLCTGLSVYFLFRTLINFFSEQTARIAILAPVLLLSFTQEVDFVHYSSEQVPVLLLAACLWFLSQLIQNTGFVLRNNLLLGLSAGMVPFAKLQAVPLAVVLVMFAFYSNFRYYQKTKSLHPFIILIIGGLTFPLFVLGLTVSFDVFDDLIDFYILGNVIYAGGNNTPSIIGQFLKIVGLSNDFKAFSIVTILAVFGAIEYLLFRRTVTNTPKTIVVILAATLAVSSIYAVTKSGNDFIHYLNFCIASWTLLAAFGIHKLGTKAIVIPAILLLFFLKDDALSYRHHHTLNAFVSDSTTTTLAQSPVVKELKRYTRTGDMMTVWGWQCRYYVEAQLAEGTSENHSERSIFVHDLQEKYRSRYLSDIQRTTPAVFLDAVGKNSFWVQDRKTQGFENFPALADFIRANYTHKGTFDDTRLYVRNDRL